MTMTSKADVPGGPVPASERALQTGASLVQVRNFPNFLALTSQDAGIQYVD